MDKINKEDFKRNKSEIMKKLKKSGDTYIAKEKLFIYFPEKYIDKKLANLDNISKILGVFAISDLKRNYAVFVIPGTIDIIPNEINNVEIDKEVYVELVIEPGEPILNSTKVVKSGDMVYSVFELLVLQGKVPWYLNYEDLFNVFKNIPKYTGTKVGTDTLTFEILIAIAARDKNDLDKLFKNSIKTHEEALKKEPAWVGLKNIHYTFNSTLSKIAGSYMKEGLISAIVKPEKEVTELEKVLRS